MSRLLNKPIVAALGGFFLTAPFIILEWINTPGFWSLGIPPLFFIMWFSGSIFIFILGSILRSLQGEKKTDASLFFLVVKVAVLILLAWIFVGLVIDQWPCFMGVPNCD